MTAGRIVRTHAGTPEHEAALAVRRAVFVEGQDVPEELEVDEHEEAAIHFVAYDGDTPVGAARLRELDAETAKVERVAVLADRRGEGWGARLMDVVETVARARGRDHLVLHAQTPVADFYERRGYRRTSDEFEEAGIPHVEMERTEW